MPGKHAPFGSVAVSRVFAAYPPAIRRKLMALRQLVFDTAASIDGVGRIDEALKWGEPAYLTAESKTGSTIRIDWKPARPSEYAMYFNCRTTLVDTFRTLFPDDLRFEGNRAVVFDARAALPAKELSVCIAAALTYHRKR